MKYLIIALGLGLASAAQAQDFEDATRARKELPSGLGATVTIGGGVSDFTNSEMADRTTVGGNWNVRASYGTRSYIGGELAYVGSARGFDSSDANLISNGAEVQLRVQAPISFDGERGLVEPFAVGGVGVQSFDIIDGSVPGLPDNDVVYTVPIGAGIGGSYDQVYLDTRVVWRGAYDSEMAGGNDGLSTVEWSANLGGEF